MGAIEIIARCNKVRQSTTQQAACGVDTIVHRPFGKSRMNVRDEKNGHPKMPVSVAAQLQSYLNYRQPSEGYLERVLQAY